MSFLQCFKPKYLQLSVFLTATLFSQIISATQMDLQWTFLSRGSTAFISLDPPLPRRGEPFTIEIAGTWNSCWIDRYEKVDVSFSGQYIDVRTSYSQDVCLEGPGPTAPTPFTRSVVVPGSAWEDIDEKKPLRVGFSVWTGLITFYAWSREFDLSWGLHEIPPQIGSGHWISDERPFQGLNVEQQGDTVLVYDLAYRGDNGQPRWLMGHARFYGDVTHGVTHHVSWLNPSSDQPKEDEMSFTEGSFGIEAVGVNQIKVFSRYWWYTTYKRYVFRLDDNQLPVVIPNMAGQWNLYAFDNQNLEASFLIEFRAATKSDKGLGWYRFKSLDDQWVLDCWANLNGVGTCILTNEGLGITMSYDLLDFNGNYAKVPLLTSNTDETTQTGILLRAGFHLPVLDFQ